MILEMIVYLLRRDPDPGQILVNIKYGSTTSKMKYKNEPE